MTANQKDPNKSQALAKQITARLDQLAQLTDAARITDEFSNWIKTCGKFHRYSLGNQILIMCQQPNATMVAGYNDWIKKHHRFVKKG
jgi:hypothetical protein